MNIREIAYQAIQTAPGGRDGYVALLAEILTIAFCVDGWDINQLAADATARATGADSCGGNENEAKMKGGESL